VNDPEEAYAAALATLPGMGPAGLVAAFRRCSPADAWAEVRAGRLVRPGGADPAQGALGLKSGQGKGRRPWAGIARQMEPPAWWASRAATGIRCTWYGAPTYPLSLIDDPQPPGVLFWTGALEWLRGPCVAIVGTRNATPDGRAVAFEMGRDLAAAGVCVVSGLAIGIDGAAHRGAVTARHRAGAAGPVGVAASGVDAPYPQRHADLWQQVADCGAILSEALPGRPAEAWRFPFRNRLIAGLSQMVVVVESHSSGGSLITAEAAIERGIDVRAVPGPVHSPASAGSNQLLYDGPAPVRGARDVLDALGVIGPAVRHPRGERAEVCALAPVERAVLEAISWRPKSLGDIMASTGMTIGAASRAVEELEGRGLVSGRRGWWVRSGRPSTD
jgi:DNA processing protein